MSSAADCRHYAKCDIARKINVVGRCPEATLDGNRMVCLRNGRTLSHPKGE
jgi:hypothetical protein